jgi:alkanesulfonate monooxygenase SsuD/methylene tetrahydromethanopterin reductase-like flavin-dependent oxidoreductase (luciferase family)
VPPRRKESRDETWRGIALDRCRGRRGDPAAIREFAQTAEEIGYQDLAAPDHVLGVNVTSRPDWGDRNTSADLFHDPFVLFGFLPNCTRNVEFSTQVLILAQRQAVLVAKQATSLDMLCGGRFRLGVGVGWNPVEFIGLNENFRKPRTPRGGAGRGNAGAVGRAARHLCWQVPHDRGWRHQPAAAPPQGPDLVRRPCRGDDAARRRMGRRLDAAQLRAGRRSGRGLRQTARDGRGGGTRSASIGIDTRTTVGIGAEVEWRETVRFWKSCGVTI